MKAVESAAKTSVRYLLLPVCIWAVVQGFLALSVQFVQYDEAIFLDVARNIARSGVPKRSIDSSGVFFFDHTPLYVYVLGLFSKLSLDRVVLLRLITSLFSLASVVLVFRTVAAYAGNLAACVGATILSLNPYYAVYSYHIRMEVPMCFFILLAGYQIQRWESTGRGRNLLFSALSIAIAVMLKEIALLFWATAVLYCVMRAWRQRSWWRSTLLLLLPSVAALAVWMTIAWSLSPTATAAVIQRWLGALWAGGSAEGGRTAVSGWVWLQSVGSDVLGSCLSALLGASAIRLVVDWRCGASIIRLHILHIGSILVATTLISLKEPRFAIALVPTATIVVASVIDWGEIIARIRRMAGSWAVLLIVGLGAWALSPLRIVPMDASGARRWLDPVFAQRVIDNDEYYGALARAGSYLKAHTPTDAVITVIHEGPVVGYYADRPYRMLYTLTMADAIDTLAGSEYLVYDHIIFVQQTEREIQEVQDYIDANFGVELEILDRRRVVILRRTWDG